MRYDEDDYEDDDDFQEIDEKPLMPWENDALSRREKAIAFVNFQKTQKKWDFADSILACLEVHSRFNESFTVLEMRQLLS